jgi:phosphatidylserine decarboxylase
VSTDQQKPTDAEMRMIKLFLQIEDKDIQEIIADVVRIERQHRTGSRQNFPLKDVRNVVDRVARFQESNMSS